MTQLMAQGSELVDSWVTHCVEAHATTPELIALMLMNSETSPNRVGLMAIIAASAVQRLAAVEMDFGTDDAGDTNP